MGGEGGREGGETATMPSHRERERESGGVLPC